MIIEIKIPSPGESVSEVEIAQWLVEDGEYVEKDQEIAEIESDKATLPLVAEQNGIISISAEAGKVVAVGTVACTIDTDADPEPGQSRGLPDSEPSAARLPSGETVEEQPAGTETASKQQDTGDKVKKKAAKTEATGKTADKPYIVGDKQTETLPDGNSIHEKQAAQDTEPGRRVRISPLAQKLMDEEGLSADDVIMGMLRITKEDVESVAQRRPPADLSTTEKVPASRDTERKRMSMLRRNLSRRLVAVRNETAMLTTFNEVDMSSIISIRKKYQSTFTNKHGVKLGFMSFFTKAVTAALKIYPSINSYIDGEDIVTPGYCDIGIAVQTDKGLMVPVIRNTETLGFAEIEKKILALAEKARSNRISIDDLTGGTFSITNGGIFGSLLSTPILNPPQSGILGMHNIVERPVAVEGRVEIRPLMYIALSYDHRVIDGRDSVGFLVKVKEMLENPLLMMSGGTDPVSLLLDI